MAIKYTNYVPVVVEMRVLAVDFVGKVADEVGLVEGGVVGTQEIVAHAKQTVVVHLFKHLQINLFKR